jgi:hypothetical protein
MKSIEKATSPVGFFIRFFFLNGYFSNYFCPHHDNTDIVIISGPIEAVSVSSSYAFTWLNNLQEKINSISF